MFLKNKIPKSAQRAACGVILMLAMAACALAQELGIKEPVIVNGDTVEYFQEKKEVIGTGNISIYYQDIVLTCDKITVNLQTRDAECIGNVKISQKDAYLTGEKIMYNFDTRKGTVINGYLNAKPFYGRAGDLGKEADKDEYYINNGYATTCDFDKPHYRIQAQQIKIYPDKVVAKNVLFYVGNVPIAWLPYYVQPLGKERKSHITVIPGQSKDWGYYALTAYRYYLNDDSKGDILLDYRSKKGLGLGINHYLNTKEIGRGAFKFYYIHENDNLAFEKTGEVRSRYRYQYRHRWDMPALDTTAVIEFNKLSDPDIIKDYFYNEYEEIGDKPDNYISIVTSKREYSTELLIRKRFNKFYDVVERLPEYKIDIPNWRIGDSSFYYKLSASGAFLNHTYPKTNPENKDVSAIRFDAYNQISYAARLFNALSVTPYAGIRETYYSRNKWGDTNLVRSIFQEGVDTSMKFYKIYDVETNFMGLDIHKLRHIITPRADYYHRHQPTIAPENLNEFDVIDTYDTANGFKLSLENRLQTKRGTAGDMRSVDLATLIVSTDYQFRLKKKELHLKSNKFDGIDFRLELVPYSWMYVTSTAHVNTKKYLVDQTSIDLVANGGEKWSVATSLRYENTESSQSTLVAMDIRYKINDKWSVRAYERFDLWSKKFEEQQYTISRDLHCWVAELTYSIRDNLANHTLWFVMKLKAFPDYPIGLQQTYSRPQFGSTGANE